MTRRWTVYCHVQSRNIGMDSCFMSHSFCRREKVGSRISASKSLSAPLPIRPTTSACPLKFSSFSAFSRRFLPSWRRSLKSLFFDPRGSDQFESFRCTGTKPAQGRGPRRARASPFVFSLILVRSTTPSDDLAERRAGALAALAGVGGHRHSTCQRSFPTPSRVSH